MGGWKLCFVAVLDRYCIRHHEGLSYMYILLEHVGLDCKSVEDAWVDRLPPTKRSYLHMWSRFADVVIDLEALCALESRKKHELDAATTGEWADGHAEIC